MEITNSKKEVSTLRRETNLLLLLLPMIRSSRTAVRLFPTLLNSRMEKLKRIRIRRSNLRTQTIHAIALFTELIDLFHF